MRNTTIMEAAILLSLTHMFVNRPTYLMGFMLAGLFIIFHYRAVKADYKRG